MNPHLIHHYSKKYQLGWENPSRFLLKSLQSQQIQGYSPWDYQNEQEEIDFNMRCPKEKSVQFQRFQNIYYNTTTPLIYLKHININDIASQI